MKLLQIIFLILFLTSCSSPSPRPPVEVVPVKDALNSIPKLGKAEPITANGDNFSPALSQDGKKLLFVSRLRLQHRHSQVYELDLSTLQERRITFSDGTTDDPIYSQRRNYIFYSSTTDEIKERPLILQKILKSSIDSPIHLGLLDPRESGEVYSSSLDGNAIVRWTKRPGFDGYISPQGNDILYISIEKSQFRILKQRSPTKKPKILYRTSQPIAQVRAFGENGTVAFVQIDNSNNTSHILITTEKAFSPQVLPLKEGFYRDPFFSIDGKALLISAKFTEKDDFDIYWLNLESHCLQKLVDHPGDDISPNLSPDGKNIFFVNRTPKLQQIYRMPFEAPAKSCL